MTLYTTWRMVRDQLDEMETIDTLQADDLKVETEDFRIYLSRVGEYPDTLDVNVEVWDSVTARWEIKDYDPDEVMDMIDEARFS